MGRPPREVEAESTGKAKAEAFGVDDSLDIDEGSHDLSFDVEFHTGSKTGVRIVTPVYTRAQVQAILQAQDDTGAHLANSREAAWAEE